MNYNLDALTMISIMKVSVSDTIRKTEYISKTNDNIDLDSCTEILLDNTLGDSISYDKNVKEIHFHKDNTVAVMTDDVRKKIMQRWGIE